MRTLVVGASVVAALILLAGEQNGAAQDKKPKYTISEVMKGAHANKLVNKVAGGKGDKADAEKLLEYYTALTQNKPPKGSAEDWKKKTEALVAGAKKAVAGDKDFGPTLTKASNCTACHKAHKG